MICNVIATGSTGNAVLVNDCILIDCGVSWKALQPYSDRIKLVLLTHQHGDHFKPSTVRALHTERPSVPFACCEWMAWRLRQADVDPMQINVMQPGRLYTFGAFGVSVSPQFIPHNVPNCGWHIFTPDGQRAFYATDCSTLETVSALNYDLYMIEANHSAEEIARRIKEKMDAGEFAYELQAAKNHLSEEQAREWLAANAGDKSKYVFLHQHHEKNPQ